MESSENIKVSGVLEDIMSLESALKFIMDYNDLKFDDLTTIKVKGSTMWFGADNIHDETKHERAFGDYELSEGVKTSLYHLSKISVSSIIMIINAWLNEDIKVKKTYKSLEITFNEHITPPEYYERGWRLISTNTMSIYDGCVRHHISGEFLKVEPVLIRFGGND